MAGDPRPHERLQIAMDDAARSVKILRRISPWAKFKTLPSADGPGAKIGTVSPELRSCALRVGGGQLEPAPIYEVDYENNIYRRYGHRSG